MAFTDEELAAAAEMLTAADARGMLHHRFTALCGLFARLRHLEMATEGLHVIECGARQLDPPVEIESAHSPEIARFFALYGGGLGMEYLAFDPAYDGKSDDEHGADDPLRKRLREVSLPHYKDVVKAAKRDRSVIFSYHVLNAPALDEEQPFWTLPGVHVHGASFAEMCVVRGLGDPQAYAKAQEQALAVSPSEGSVGERIAAFRDAAEKEMFLADPSAHVAAFKRRFGLPDDLKVQCRLEGDGTVTYGWEM